MAQKIEVRVQNRVVGKIEFEESDDSLRRRGAFRTPDGFLFYLPGKLTLDWQTGVGWQPLVSSLRARVMIDDNSGIEFGVAEDRNWYSPLNPRLEDRDLQLELRGPLEALQILEKRRNGRGPKFWVQMSGEVCPTYKFKTPEGTNDMRGLPERIFGELHLGYPQETWAVLVDSIGLTSNVVVEAPLRKDVPPEWKEVISALDEAHRGLLRGGDDGWKASVVSARLALETWRGIEREACGPGWSPPKGEDKEKWTKRERLDAVRWHLHHLANLSPHSPAEHWNRNDALLALVGVAALLGTRDP